MDGARSAWGIRLPTTESQRLTPMRPKAILVQPNPTISAGSERCPRCVRTTADQRIESGCGRPGRDRDVSRARCGSNRGTNLRCFADSQCCLPACGRLAAPSPWRPPSAGSPSSTRLVDHTGRAARRPGPVTMAACRAQRGRACSPYMAWRRCLPETSSPRPRLLGLAL
eukprot:COSAG01_NODE_13194_length_1621_cov_564.188568_2_plen_169_part_00